MMKFELIAEQVKQDAEQRKRETAEIIEKGYLSRWSEEHHEQNDNGLRRDSTATRWEQYTSGKITRAEALNQCDSVLKALYSFKEKQMREGQNDHSRTACTGHDNRNIIGYGAGYSTMPYFEGGVGASCFWLIFERLGYTCRGNHSGRNFDYYHIEKKTA